MSVGGELLLCLSLMSGAAALAYHMAKTKHRNRFAWTLLAFLIPITALIVSFLSPLEDANSFRDCPFCAEKIKKQACICRYCGRDVQPILTPVPQVKKKAAPVENKADPDLVPCPHCSKLLYYKVSICKFCGQPVTLVKIDKQ